jgi:hypothetical protein
MKRLLPVFLAFASLLAASGQSIPPPDDASTQNATAPESPAPKPVTSSSSKAGHPSNAALQAAIDRLTRSNQELLDLLKQQQSVLEDIQYDRRLQNRQITLLEQRLEDTLQTNASLQAKVAGLQAQVTAGTGKPAATADTDTTAPAVPPPADVTPAPPPPPSTYLPPEQTEGAPGTMWWHRLFTLSGTDSQNSQTFQVSGKQWRVLWHNQDKPGDAYKNTSALFINAFPTGDSIPKKVCSQLGNGDDSTELTGTGEFYLKIEASGGHWELAVEDFR